MPTSTFLYRKSSQRYLGLAVEVEGKKYHFQSRALPFGLSSSLRIFTKVPVEVLAPLRLKTVTILPYLDDLLFAGPTEVQLVKELPVAQQWLKSLGWILNIFKSNLLPAQNVQFLGY